MIKILDIEGLNIACRINDAGFREGRKGLIFVHGSGGNHTMWKGQYDAMENDFNVAAIDLPGHGSSGGGGEEDVYRYMDWVRKAIEMLSLENPVIVGHSLGSAISLALALTGPGMLSGIVVVGGGATMPVSQMVFDGIRGNFQGFIEFFPDLAVHRKNLEGVRDSLLEGFSQTTADVFFGDFTACNGFDIAGRLGEIGLPTLIVCGDKDRMMPPEFSQALHGKIEGSRLEMISQCGHFPMLEKKVDFNAILGKFVGAL